MRLFDSFKKKNPQKAKRLLPEEVELQAKIKAQDNLILEKNEAEKKYKETGEVEPYFNFFQSLFSDEERFSMIGNWAFQYPEVLIKEKRFNEAWGALNQLYLALPDSKGRIYNMRYQILKAEKKHPRDAIFDLMAASMYKVKGVIDPVDFYLTTEKKLFLKKAKPLSKNAGFTEKDLEYLSYLIESQISKNKYSDSALEKMYSSFLKEKS